MLDEENSRYIAGNQIIDLSERQLQIMSMLINNKGRVVTFDEIQKAIYKNKTYYNYSNVRIIIFRLIKKLKGTLEIKKKTKVGYYV